MRAREGACGIVRATAPAGARGRVRARAGACLPDQVALAEHRQLHIGRCDGNL